MDEHVTSLNRLIKKYDPKLYAKRSSNGMVQVYRDSVRWESYSFGSGVLSYSRPNPHLIFCLTDTWSIKGRPVEWGLEPVYSRLQMIDDHNRAVSVLEELEKQEARQQELDARAQRNDIRARAADMRKDFAKATNDINTSTIAKIDNRRLKGA